MDKAEFLELKNLDINEISLREASAMDKFIKETALRNAEIILKRDYPTLSDKLMDYLIQSLNVDFGSVEVDELLIHLKAYPDWLI